MDNYKKASKLQLRFTTEKGVLSVEQLWGLPFYVISNSIKDIKKLLKKNDDDELSFLDDSKVIDSENELRFEILKDIYITRKTEQEEIRTAADTKEHNQKILGLIQKKKEDSLSSMSVEELEALLKR